MNADPLCRISYFPSFSARRGRESLALVPAMRPKPRSGDTVRLGYLIDKPSCPTIPAFHAPDLGASGTIQTHACSRSAQNGIAQLEPRLGDHDLPRHTDDPRRRSRSAVPIRGPSSGSQKAPTCIRSPRCARLISSPARTRRRASPLRLDTHRPFRGLCRVQGSLSLRRSPVRVSGSLLELEIVVLARPLARGETLLDSDILTTPSRSEVARVGQSLRGRRPAAGAHCAPAYLRPAGSDENRSGRPQ